MKKGLLRFSVVVLIVLTSVVVVDMIVGKVMDWMLPQISNQGDTGRTYYSLNDVNTPIVIVGSSRAAHHYVTQIVEDSLGMPAYNVARDGCFFSYNCCVVNSILDRYTPKLIIWENGTGSLYEGIPNPLESMYPYYGNNKWVKKTIKEELSWKEYVRLNSHIYKFNSIIHRVLMRYRGRKLFIDVSEKGYQPLTPKKLPKALELEIEPITGTILSDSKISAFRSILSRAKEKGVRIVVVSSPMYRLVQNENFSAEKMLELCEEYGMWFLDNSQLSYFLKHPELFNDATHMNNEGAKKYTEMFLVQIGEYVNSLLSGENCTK